MFLMIDNYDSFVYNLVRYFEELDQTIMVVRNDKLTMEDIASLGPEGIILSPGPKAPQDAGVCLEVINSFKGQVPILGICLGHQCIAHCFGGMVNRGSMPVHGKVSNIRHDEKGLFNSVKNPLKVTRYHSLVVDKNNLPEELNITAQTEDGVIMGLQHKNYHIYGLQFHPEAELTEEGHLMLNNYIHICKEFKRCEE